MTSQKEPIITSITRKPGLVSRHHARTSGSRSQQSSRRLIYTASSVGACGYRRLEALYRSIYGLLFHDQITEEPVALQCAVRLRMPKHSVESRMLYLNSVIA